MHPVLKLLALIACCVPAAALAQPAQPPAPPGMIASDYVAKRMLKEVGEDLGMQVLGRVGGLDPTGVAGIGVGIGLMKLQEAINRSREEEDQRLEAELDRIEKQFGVGATNEAQAPAAPAPGKTPQRRAKVKQASTGREKR